METVFFVRPLEGVSFGPPRSQFMGESVVRPTQWPAPMTFQGLVRSHLLRAVEPRLDLMDHSRTARAERTSLVGDGAALPEGWQFHGPFPVQVQQIEDSLQAEPWVPTPRFLIGSRKNPLPVRPLSQHHPGRNDLSPDREPLLLGRPDQDAGNPLEGYIGPRNLLYALRAADEKVQPGRAWEPKQHG